MKHSKRETVRITLSKCGGYLANKELDLNTLRILACTNNKDVDTLILSGSDLTYDSLRVMNQW
jgi:hypothetical protein